MSVFHVKLKEPIEQGSETITEFNMKKLKAKHFRIVKNLDSMTTDETLDLIGKSATQPKAVIDELGIADMAACMDVLSNFFEDGPETGEQH